ncbi:MAG: signal recognition particle protein [Clostridia bacterium]|nr:MAG: signal recognition particle protein [Clostridia bacterium]
MFDNLSDKLQDVFDSLGSKGRLSEADVDKALRQVRLALLEADVNYKVVKDFVGRVKTRAIGADVLHSLSPAQQVIKIVHEELIKTLGETEPLDLSGSPPHVMMLVGLQGSGKTTTAAKLARRLRKQGQRPLLIAADTYRPAAVKQLEVLGEQLDIPVHSEGIEPPPPDIVNRGLRRARQEARTVVIIDTAGRLTIDEQMMEELVQIKSLAKPGEVLLVADAMTGQEAVRVASDFHKRVGLTGLVLTKIDGDARGGAAISMRSVTGVPIKFIGVSEKLDGLEPFHPDRMASRILGMGDVLTMIEKAEEVMDKQEASRMEKKLRNASFDLDDFLKQMRQVRKMGPISNLLGMIPGMGRIAKEIDPESTDKQLSRIEAIISSMTLEERRNPRVLNASRKRRVAKGSGVNVQEVNELLSQFRQMQRLMKQLQSGKRGGLGGLLGGLGG